MPKCNNAEGIQVVNKMFSKFFKNEELFILGNITQHASLKYLKECTF